jgi:sigma-E factor negative regulatory protein RseB
VTRGRRPPALLVAGLGVALLMAGLVGGTLPTRNIGAHAAALEPPDNPAVAIHRLVLACRASTSLPFSGLQHVRVVSDDGVRSSTIEVVHVPGSGVQLTVRPTQTSKGGVFVGQLDGPSLLPTIDESTLARISSRYGVRGPQPGTPIAGRATDVVELVRTSGSSTGSVAARFWLDRTTSLPLQREVLDGAGRVQQASTFVSISYHRPAAIPRVARLVGSPPDLGQGVSPSRLESLRSSGWLAPGRLPDDFDLVDARVRGMNSVPSESPPLVLQLSYTDGISVVSLFEQRGSLDPGPVTTWLRQKRGDGTVWVDRGVPERVVWSASGSVYTLVSDDPGVVDAAMSALPQPTSSPGLWNRLRHGLARLVSWVNPFG